MNIAIEFGSQIRGDANTSSDRDLLVISDVSEEMNQDVERYRRTGYAVSYFSYDAACYLARSGNLFFKHVFDEGCMLRGDEDAYCLLSHAWKPQKNYNNDIEENIDLLEVVDYVPETIMGIQALSDILISSVRNVLIRKLAGYGIYVFSWDLVFKRSSEFGFLNTDDIPVFREARLYKNHYRKGEVFEISRSFIALLVAAASRAIGTTINVRHKTRRDIDRISSQFSQYSYKQLRSLELLCAAYSQDQGLSAIRSWVKDPACFCRKNHPY